MGEVSGSFLRVLVVLKRFKKVVGGSARVWNGFLKFEKDVGGFTWIYKDLTVWEEPGRTSGGSPGWFSKGFSFFGKVLGGFWTF